MINPADLPWSSVLDARSYGSLTPTGIAQLFSSAQATLPPSAILLRIEQLDAVLLVEEPTMTTTRTEWEEVPVEVPPRPDASTATIEERLTYLEARDLASAGPITVPVTISETVDLPVGAVGWFGHIASPVFVDDSPLPEEESSAPLEEQVDEVNDASNVE